MIFLEEPLNIPLFKRGIKGDLLGLLQISPSPSLEKRGK
jgi:hypothetical protein